MIVLLLAFGIGGLFFAALATVCDGIRTRNACRYTVRRVPDDVVLRASRKAGR